MVLSKAAPPRIARPVGRPLGQEMRSVEQQARHFEEAESWGRVRYLGNVIHLAVTAERPDIAAHSAGELVLLAQRRLRQLGPEEIA